MIRLALAAALAAAMLAAGCTTDADRPQPITVLADPALADLEPLLVDLRRETGIDLRMDYAPTVSASRSLATRRDDHQFAWLASDRWLRLLAKDSGVVNTPQVTPITTSPVVVGVSSRALAALGGPAGAAQATWADVAAAAASGELRFAMEDPQDADTGLSALVGVATAAAGTGKALTVEDVGCERLRGFFAGLVPQDDSGATSIDWYVEHQDQVDAVIGYESTLLTANASGRLAEPLSIVYPRDGMMLADHPLILIDENARPAYTTVVNWLRSPPIQKKIMDVTLRRPLVPGVERDPQLGASIGNSAFVPGRQEVVDRLLEAFATGRAAEPAHVIFVLDYSGSMRGPRVAALRNAFAGLSGDDRSASGRFLRFYRGETLTVMRFGGTVLGRDVITYSGPADLDRLRAAVAVDRFADRTAVWTALDEAYATVTKTVAVHPTSPITVVLMTDGESNAGISLQEFVSRQAKRPPAARAVPTVVVHHGQQDAAALRSVVRLTGGRLVDASERSLLDAFKEIHGCVA